MPSNETSAHAQPGHGYLMTINEAYESPSAPVTNDNHNMPISQNEAYGCTTASSEASSHCYLMKINAAYESPSAPVTNDNHSIVTSQNDTYSYLTTSDHSYAYPTTPSECISAVCGATADDDGYVVNQLVYDDVQSSHSQDTQ